MTKIASYNKENEIRDAAPKKNKSMERIASLDFQRGLAIFIMVFIHGAANIIDHSYIEENPSVIAEMPWYIIVILAVLAFFGIWNSYFLLISTTVNSYAMTRGILAGKEPKQILFKQTMTGLGLLVLNMFHNSFLLKGYFGQALVTGDWTNTYPLWNGFFIMGTLRIIGLSMIINSLLMFFLLRDNGHKQFLRNIVILGSLALAVIISSEFINNWVDSLSWITPNQLPTGVELGDNVGWPNRHFQALNHSIKAWLCALISGDVEPLFPFLASAFIGSMIGMCLAQPQKVPRINLIGGLTGVGIMGVGGLFVALGFFAFGTVRPPIGNYLVMLGGQLIVFFVLFRLVESRGKGEKFANNPVVKHFRLWGMVSLTLFVLDILDMLPRILFGLSYNWLFSANINTIQGHVFGSGQEYLAIIYAIFAILFYELIIYLWSRVNFYLSFEWMVVQVVGAITKNQTKRLDVEMMMNDVHWISFEKAEKQKQLPKQTPS